MKREWYSIVLVGVVLLGLSFGAQVAHADCQADGTTAPIDGGNDNIDCSGGDDTDGVITDLGNDTVTTHAVGGNINFASGDAIIFFGNGSLQGDGDVTASSWGINAFGDMSNSGSGNVSGGNNGIHAGGDVSNSGSGNVSAGSNGIDAIGNVSNSGSGNVSGGGNGINAFGDVSNSGSGNVSGGSNGILAFGNVSNSGSGNVSGNTGIQGYTPDQTFTLTGGAITGTGGTAVDAWLGNDTVIIAIGSVTINGSINGGTGDSDSLQLTGNATPAEYGAALLAANACNTSATSDDCSGSLTFGGFTYTFTNFEQLVVLLTAIANGELPGDGGGAAPSQTGVQAICEGAIKVFRQPNGDLDVYSGFDLLPPNGFMIGRISQAELAAGVRRFQDIGTAAQLGWVVEVTISDKLIIQVFDGQGNPIGTCQV